MASRLAALLIAFVLLAGPAIAQQSAVPALSEQGNRPNPDPTVLTTQSLLREILNLREIIETRIDAMDKALQLLQAKADKVPSETDIAVGRLKDLHDERFKGVATQFAERDIRTEQTSRDSKVAVDAALQAAKEAVGEQNKSSALAIAKSEASTTKQIDQIIAINQATTSALNDKIDDLKLRLTQIDGQSTGARDLWAMLLGGLAIIISLVIGFVTILNRTSPRVT